MNIEELSNCGVNGSGKGILIVELTSKWCNSCKGLTTILQKYRDEGLINLVKIDIDKNPLITRILDINSIPTLLFFKDGNLLNRDIEIYDYPFVKKGMMVGITCEQIIKEIIKLV